VSSKIAFLSTNIVVLIYLLTAVGLTLIRSVLAYGSETWVLSKSSEARLGVFERKVLRAIFGTTNDNGEWRIK